MSQPPPATITRIAIVDFASGANGDLNEIAEALQTQVLQHFSLPPPYGWGLGAVIRVAKNDKDVAPEEWVLGLYAHPDQPGALGYHDRTTSGQPFMKIFPQLDMQDNVPWSTTASHEILETLLDPELSRAVQAPSGHFWALEVCDFVENDSYVVQGIPVSNFNLPFAFEPLAPNAHSSATRIQPGSAPFDWMQTSSAPFQIRPGGYGQWWDGRKWVTAEPRTSSRRKARATLDAHGLSRHARRARIHSRTNYGDPRFMI